MKVSVCITHYDRIALLERAINSVLSQSNLIGEIIVVDDCSPEHIQSELRMKFRDAALVHFIFLEKNQGPQIARNIAIDAAKYEITAFMDCDDVWLENKISTQLEFIDHYELDLCACGFVTDGKPDFQAERFYPPYDGDAIKYLCSGGHMQTSTLLMRSEAAKLVKFDISVRKFQDWDFIFRAAKNGLKIGYLNQRLVDYSKLAADQMTKSYDPEYARKFILDRLDYIGRQNATLFFINRLSAMYFKKGLFISAISAFVQPIYEFRCFKPLAIIKSLRRFLYYKFGV